MGVLLCPCFKRDYVMRDFVRLNTFLTRFRLCVLSTRLVIAAAASPPNAYNPIVMSSVPNVLLLGSWGRPSGLGKITAVTPANNPSKVPRNQRFFLLPSPTRL